MRYLFAICLAVFLAAPAAAVDRVKLLSRDQIDREFIFGQNAADLPATYTLTQRILTARKSILGISSAQSIVKPDASVTGVPFITTADWPNGSALTVGPVESITIDGGQTILDAEYSAADAADVADAVKISTLNPRLRNALIKNWRGTGVYLTWPNGQTNPSAKIEANIIERCYKGIALVGDEEVIGNTIRACRDYGAYAPEPASNISLLGNHFYGINGRSDGTTYDGICVYHASGSGWRTVGGTMADSHNGYVAAGGSSHTSTINGVTFFKNSINCIDIRDGATNFAIDGCTISTGCGTGDAQFANPIGVNLAGDRSTLSDSIVSLTSTNPVGLPGAVNAGRATGVKVTGNANTVVNTVFLDFGHPSGKATGINIASAAVRGFGADVRIWGFSQSGDCFLDIDSNAIQGVHVVIRGNSADDGVFDPTNIAQYVDIPADWSGSLNSITLIDEADNQTVTATGGTAY